MKLRIVRDNYNGYEVQVWRWWWPVWVMAGFCNTFCSVEEAERWARVWARADVVKEIKL
jgi:hypothetical protein